MENAADALKMAAAVLIFIIAIATSFSVFGIAKETADSIIGIRDKQAYLEAVELDTVLYTSSDKISEGDVVGITSNGDRIVSAADVVSTIYRYSKEKYGVTIIQNGNAIARFDSITESYIQNYNNYGQEFFKQYKEIVRNNIKTDYCNSPKFMGTDKIEDLYKIEVSGNTKIIYGAPWYGNDAEIQKRINTDLSESDTYSYNGQTYTGKNLFNILKSASEIIEVTNEIDQSKYLEDNGQQTNLLQQYSMPTVEVIYIVYN